MTRIEFGETTFTTLLRESVKPSLIAIHPTDSISQALDILSSQNILQVPVFSRAFPTKVASIINLFDILSFITLQKTPVDLNEKTVEETMTLDLKDESYRIWERDFRDTIQEVNRFAYTFLTHSLDNRRLFKGNSSCVTHRRPGKTAFRSRDSNRFHQVLEQTLE